MPCYWLRVAAPYTGGLDLENAGVNYDESGITVNNRLRSSRKNIYAAGDCTGGYQFTHYAGWQAYMAVRNALIPGSSRGVKQNVPWTTFTDPEVAHAGFTERQAKEKFGGSVKSYVWPMNRVDRARTEGETDGFIKVVYRRNGKLLGVTIVAGRAGEMIHEWVLAMNRGLKIVDLSRAVHVYPTYSIANMELSSEFGLTRLMEGFLGKIIRVFAKRK